MIQHENVAHTSNTLVLCGWRVVVHRHLPQSLPLLILQEDLEVFQLALLLQAWKRQGFAKINV